MKFKYFAENCAANINNRTQPGVTHAVYTDYDSDEHGDYTYFIGAQVDSFDDQPGDFEQLTIPASQYQKFTTGPGAMPGVVISAWQAIWQMDAEKLGGQRSYIADFEVYDERAADPENTVIDIFIGLK